MYQTKNLGLNITEIEKDSLSAFNFDTDLGNNFKAIDEKTLSHRNITNCLLEVPQDIKAECSNGTLTIKAGSKIWIPYGTTEAYKIGDLDIFGNMVVDTSYQDNKFFYAFELQEDKTNNLANTDAIDRICWFNLTDDAPNALQAHSSGTEGYTGAYNQFYYFTNTNYANIYLSGVKSEKVMSLPIGFVKGDGVNMYGSVSQVFNGFGYIGSTVFALPGVKCLIPRGRNEDGSLKSDLFTSTTVKIHSATSDYSNPAATMVFDSLGNIGVHQYFEGDEIPTNNSYAWVYHRPSNLTYQWDDTTFKYITITTQFVRLADVNVASGQIKSLTIKKPFHAVDYNDYQTKITELETKIATLQAAVEALQGS